MTVPWDFIEKCSDSSLQNFLMAKENHASNLLKSIAAEIEEVVRMKAEAEIARILLQSGDELLRISSLRQGVLGFPCEETKRAQIPDTGSPHRLLNRRSA